MFSGVTILSTREAAQGSRVLGQVVPVPSGRLDKVSVYLEPEFADPEAFAGSMVKLEVYQLDSQMVPLGMPLASDAKTVEELRGRGMANFRVEANVPTKVGIVLRFEDGDAQNYVGWRFIPVPSTGTEYLLTSSDGGTTWGRDNSRKFAYIAYSFIPDMVDLHDQSASIQAGTTESITDDTDADFSAAVLDRTQVNGVGPGATVSIRFGNFYVTLVVDQSGSMTWNDREGVRFDFLKDYIDDMEANLGALPSSSAKYSVIKFRSRKIGKMSLSLQSGSQQAGPSFEGVRLVRKLGSPVSGPSDGVVIFEGLAEDFLDGSLVPGSSCFYGAFVYDSGGNFSDARRAQAIPLAGAVLPIGASAFSVKERVMRQFCAPQGDFVDEGQRTILLDWLDPKTDDPLSDSYVGFYLTRREDRFPELPSDGTPLAPSIPSILNPGYTTLVISLSPSLIPIVAGGSYSFSDFDPTQNTVNGLTYYYSLFTLNAQGELSLAGNTRRSSVLISMVPRPWRLQEPPGNDPVLWCFNAPYYEDGPNPPNPTVIIGNGALELTWTPGAAGPLIPPTARYRLYYSPTGYPQLDNDGEIVPGQGNQVSMLYDGTGISFIHRQLTNDQPCFYALVAYNIVGNASSPESFVARPSATSPSIIPPPSVTGMTADPLNATTMRVSWRLPVDPDATMTAFFDDFIRAIATVSFDDLDPATSSATFEFVEDVDDRRVVLFDSTATPDKSGSLSLASVPQEQSNSIVAMLTIPPSLFLRNSMQSVSTSFYAALRIKDAHTGEVLMEVRTPSVSVTFNNPFALSCVNEPTQIVDRRTWRSACNAEGDRPDYSWESAPGVYVRTGESFHLGMEAQYEGQPISELPVAISFFDVLGDGSLSSQPSTRMKLPQTNASGVASLVLTIQEDEVIDRSGQPTGETRNRTILKFDLPAQDLPGDFQAQVQAGYSGYIRAVAYNFHYEPSLNVDLLPKAFAPNGVDIAEQQALIYLGSPAPAKEAGRIPAPDLTIVEWSIRPLAAQASRSLFSRDNVPGTGIKSYAMGGVAAKIFFGPGTEVTPPATPTCTDGELFEVSAKVNILGMSAVGYGVIELLPENGPLNMNRILLRNSSLAKFNRDLMYADGEAESTWEVVARPEDDGNISDDTSGKYFRNAIINLGGLVPSIEDGRIVTLSAMLMPNMTPASNVVITTNLTGGSLARAQARVDGGKAIFKVKYDARVVGKIIEVPEIPPDNIVYERSGDELAWSPSPIVISLVAKVVIETNGLPTSFGGGGSDLKYHTPPCFLSLQEPLGT